MVLLQITEIPMLQKLQLYYKPELGKNWDCVLNIKIYRMYIILKLYSSMWGVKGKFLSSKNKII